MSKAKLLGVLMAGAMSMSVLAAAPADARPDGRGPMAHAGKMHDGEHGPMMDKMFERLNLTPEQHEKIKAIRTQGQERTKGPREQLIAKRTELYQLVRSATSTKDQALAKQREVNTLQNQLAEARLASWFEMRAVLTPEQLKQFEELKPKQRKRK